MEELLDVYDGSFRPIGVASRAQAHREGLWHITVHVWALVLGASGTKVVLQRRSQQADTNPGMIDVAVAGHLRSGEDPADGLREIDEEIGIDASTLTAIPIARRFDISDTATCINRELCHVFLVCLREGISALRPDPNEVDALVEVSLDDFIKLVSNEYGTVRGVIVDAGRPQETTDFELTADQLIQRADTYWRDVAIQCRLQLTQSGA